jgi:hypothetical protein
MWSTIGSVTSCTHSLNSRCRPTSNTSNSSAGPRSGRTPSGCRRSYAADPRWPRSPASGSGCCRPACWPGRR